MNIIFIGMKHCGKTTQAKRLARDLGMHFIDSDEAVAANYAALEKENTDARGIYNNKGADYFRALEATTVTRWLNDEAFDRNVIALGGGTVGNRLIGGELAELGFFIYLKTAPELIYPRIVTNGLPSFLANAADPEAYFRELYAERNVGYTELADLIIPVDTLCTPEELNREIVGSLHWGKLI